MNVLYNKRFLKDLASILQKERNKIEQFVFEQITHIPSSSEIPKLEKLSGYQFFTIK